MAVTLETAENVRSGTVAPNASRYSPLFLFCVYAILALVVRLFTYFPSVIDSDESTYLLMAKGMLDGLVPYVDMIDIKPVGIYLLFAGLIKSFGNGILAVRLAASLAIAGTAFFLNRSFETLFKRSDLAFLVGILYILAASLHKWGWSANTEVFFSLTTAAGLYLLVRARKYWEYALFGLVMGLGVIIKYHVLMDYTAFALWFLCFPWYNVALKRRIFAVVLSGVGLVLPYGLWHLAYVLMGHWEALYEAAFLIPARYSVDQSSGESLAFFAEFYLSLAPLTAALAIVLVRMLRTSRIFFSKLGPMLIWTGFVWLGIFLTGKTFFHYYFQALLPLCFFTPLLFSEGILPSGSKLLVGFRRSRYLLLALAIGAILANQCLQLSKTDLPRKIASDINTELAPGDQIFVEYRNIIYYLTDRYPPTKYIHASVLIYPQLAFAYGVDRESELTRIMDARPRFLILEEEHHPVIDQQVRGMYTLKKVYDMKVFLWERKE